VKDRCDLLCLDLEKAEGIRHSTRVAPTAAARLQLLADPVRLQVAAALAQTDELCGCDLAWITGRSQKLISHHLKALREGGVVTRRRDGKIVFYELTPAGRSVVGGVLAAAEAPA
jgi:DNA-binding transcriptional ArsR family regulator